MRDDASHNLKLFLEKTTLEQRAYDSLYKKCSRCHQDIFMLDKHIWELGCEVNRIICQKCFEKEPSL